MLNIAIPSFFIFTGGPGAGKTSVLEELEKLNFSVIPESGRQVIQEQTRLQEEGLPWRNKTKFRDLMIEQDIEQYEQAKKREGIVLFDRGVPDSIGYSQLENIKVSESLFERVKKYPYQPLIFMMPPWEEIYVNDAERKQDFATAIATYESMKKVYLSLGYEIFEVPKVSLKERVKCIVKEIQVKGKASMPSKNVLV